jgi:hypothetical protein
MEKLESGEVLEIEDLTSPQRRQLHYTAEALNLSHDSVGLETNRKLVISKRRIDPNSPEKEEKMIKTKAKKNLEKIPNGMSVIIPEFLYLGSCRDSQYVLYNISILRIHAFQKS